ncbi:apoptosis inducing factor [Lycorma delicatula]|uniref:apoptosis inducing factor n=1 Tax=Lycorma delicatula TaxID=130591 RepID=UPI003F5124E2
MLKKRGFSSVMCNYLLFKNKCYRIVPQELKFQFRLLATSDKGGKKECPPDQSKSDGQTRPTGPARGAEEDIEPLAQTPICKVGAGPKLSGKPSMMDQLPIPQCNYEEEDKKKSGKRNALLLTGIILFALSAFTAYKTVNPKIDIPEKGPKLKKASRKSRRPWVIHKNPQSSRDIPNEIPYLLIGGGTASFSAFRAIKSRDPKAKVLVIGNEPYYPYMRPPLSKEMYYVQNREVAKKLKFKQWNGTERSLFYEPDDFYSSCSAITKEENGGVAVARGWTVKRIDATNRKVYLEDNKAIKYEKCLIATGSRPKIHPAFEDLPPEMSERVSMYRNIFDYEELEEIIETGAKSIIIVGGSFLGSELACALARRGKSQMLKVTQIIKENGNMGKVLPEYLSKWTTEKVKKEGVNVITNCQVDDVELKDSRLILHLNNGKEMVADQIVLALGVEPNSDLAKASNLEIDKDLGGYLVNAELEARSNLFVAGDCACFYDAKLGRRRVEHHDHAVVSGRLAGENMTGAGKPYFHQSMFWSDLGPDVGYEAIGIVDSSLPTVGVYAKVTKKDSPKAVSTSSGDGMRSTTEEEAEKNDAENNEVERDEHIDKLLADSDAKEKKQSEDYGKGVIFYLRDGIVVGIVLWNVFNRMSIARQVLSDERKYEDLNEVAKLFNIHKD